MDLGVMAMKGYSAFPKAPALLELHAKEGKAHLDILGGKDENKTEDKSKIPLEEIN